MGTLVSAGGPGQLWQIFVGQYLWVVSRIFVVCLEDICRGIGPEICLQVGIISHRLSANDRRLDNANHPEENSKLSERRDAQLAQAQLAVCPWETLRLTKSRKMYFQNNLRCYLYLVKELNAHGKLKRQKESKKYLTPVSTELDSDFLARWTLMAPGSTFECITSRSRPPVSRCTLSNCTMGSAPEVVVSKD